MHYQCSICGKVHDDLPDIGFTWPDHYFDVPEPERGLRIEGTADTCKIDGETCFVRGTILIPITDEDNTFGLGVWVSLKPENFESYIDNFDSADIGPYFGWLCNDIPFYVESTQLLKTEVRFQGGNQRPLITLEPGDHQLYRDYADGISLDKAFSYVHWNAK